MKRPVTIAIVLSLALTALIAYTYPKPSADNYKYAVGQPWNYPTLYAPCDIDIYPDAHAAQDSIDSLTRNHTPVYTRVTVNVDSVIEAAVGAINTTPDSLAMSSSALFSFPRPSQFIPRLRECLREAYTAGIISDSKQSTASDILLQTSPGELRRIARASLATPRDVFMRLDTIARESDCHALLVHSDIARIITPDIDYDSELDAQILSQEKARYTAATGRIIRGQTIIERGTIITAQHYTNLQNYQRTLRESHTGDNNRSEWLTVLGVALYVLAILLLLLTYLRAFEPQILRTLKKTLFLLLLISVFYFIALALNVTMASLAPYLIPLAIAPILTNVYYGGRVAIAVSLTLTLLTAPLMTLHLEYVFVQIVAGTVAVYSLRDLTQRTQLLRTSAVTACALLLAYVTVHMIAAGSLSDIQWRPLLALGIAGMLTTITYILMAAVERTFGFVSPVTLVELADTGSPLLRQLSDECPGTFQHSMAVSALCADAAAQIGADTLLVRTAALYHDIGKLTNPIFFTENQRGANPHDGLSPEKSAQIIIAHVADGLRRADRAHLPGILKDFIAQHHGCGKAKYFYITAQKQHPGEAIDPAPYTYPGPNPQTREASILMMADAVEAASRSLSEHDPQTIERLVTGIIDTQIAEHLHDQSTLSFRDVHIIKKAFTRRLTTIYHSRIKYPGQK